MKPSATGNLFVLTVVSLALGITAVLRLRASNVQVAREVRTRAMLFVLANLMALIDVTGSPFESPLDTDNILSVNRPF